MNLKLVFMGTPAFAVPSLDALAAAGFEVRCVYSQPPRPAGRGQRLEPSPVDARATTLGIPVRTPRSLKSGEASAAFAALGADAAIVVAYGLILPRAVLEAPRLGCINAHASLLPRWRGAAPIERAIMAGDAETGVTIMQMVEGLDTGPILLTRRVALPPTTTTGHLRAELAAVAGPLLVEALEGLAAGTLAATPQDDRLACYAAKLGPSDEPLDWRRSASALERAVRALDPRPGAHFIRGNERIKVWAAEVIAPSNTAATPGTVLDDRLAIQCGEGSAFRPLALQRPGRKAMPLDDFLRGYAIKRGDVLPCPASS